MTSPRAGSHLAASRPKPQACLARGNTGRQRRLRFVWWVIAAGLIVLAVAVVLWVHRFQRYTPLAVALDLRAAAAARKSPQPINTFLEHRYGPLTDPANRRKAFLDFFNPGHIEGLNLVVSRISGPRRQAYVTAMATWIADYRQTLPSEERAALRDYFQSDQGRLQLQRAATHYQEQNAYYRASTAPVIAELLATVSTTKQP